MTDERIVALLHDGSEKGLAAIMSKYSKLVRSVAAGMLGSQEDIEEVEGDVFYKVWKNRDRIDLGKSSLKSYVCMVARSCTIDKLRTLDAVSRLTDDELELGVEADFSTPDAARHNRSVIAACVRAMPSPDREVFICRFYYSLSCAETARCCGITEQRVKYILHRSKRSLRDALMKGGILL
ncbi:MAG: sigma-70 family RNA polymerase sigma factor [Ruminococcus sp.]|nr:sigma-70 family RNA polymerase sigma factor [Ruminococcus sp.]